MTTESKRSKAQRVAWWNSLTPEQQEAYVQNKMAERKARQMNRELDTELKERLDAKP